MTLSGTTCSASRLPPSRVVPQIRRRSSAGWETFKDQLHIHHMVEGAVLWPPLRQKVAGIWYPAHSGPSAKPAPGVPDANALAPVLARQLHVPEFAFDLDQFGILNRADSHHILTGRLDLTRAVAFGPSLDRERGSLPSGTTDAGLPRNGFTDAHRRCPSGRE
jgi:hypothetical protein